MTDVDAISAFIRARLDEEEADARACWGKRWDFRDDVETVFETSQSEPVVYLHIPQDGPHIARQDPVATLARVEALRALVTLHRPAKNVGGHACRTCFKPGDNEYEMSDGWWPCDTVRQLAATWSWHPDHDQENWAP